VQFGVRCNAHVSDCDRIHVRNGLARMLHKWRPHVHANQFDFIWCLMRQVWYEMSNRWSVQFGVRCNAHVSDCDRIHVRKGLARMLHKWRPHVHANQFDFIRSQCGRSGTSCLKDTACNFEEDAMLTSVIAMEFASGTVLQECYINGVHTCMQINLTSYDPNAAGPVRDVQSMERAIWSEMQCSRQ